MGHKVKQSLMSSRIDFFYYAFRNVLSVSIPLLVVSSVVLSHLSLHSSAYSSSTDSVSLSLPTSCTISANVLTPHNATLVSGQYEGNIGNTKINAYCNDNNGYFIYAIGSSNDTDGNTDLVSSINDNYNIHTNIYDGDTITANIPSSWAMKLTSSNGTYAPTIVDAYNNYNLIPSTDTIVAYRTSGTSMDLNTDLTGSYFNTTYEIYTNPIQPTGTYLGKVKYTMTHPYDASQLTTIEKAFDIAGKDKVQVTDPITGETGDYYKMQDMSSRICSLTTVYETEEKLVDIRDNKLYYVSKLKDGHCWMTQNLDLDLSSSIALTSEETDLNDNSLTGAYNLHYSYDSNTRIITWTPENVTRNYNTGTGAAWVNNNNKAYSMDVGEWYWDANDDTSDCNYLIAACEHFSRTPYRNNSTHGSTGNYYNWSAAIASDDSSPFMSNTYVDITKNPQNSICPKGWRLPVISSQDVNEFTKLNNLYNRENIDSDVGWIDAPLYFTRSGNIDGGPLYFAGFGGSNWSSTVSDYRSTYYLYFGKNTVDLAGRYGSGRTHGRSIRCLAR